LPKEFKNNNDDHINFDKIRMIFNSKNIWINLQYHNPNQILYDLWNEEQWIGLVRENKIPHVRVSGNKDTKDGWVKWQKFLKPDEK
jgi:hypothetical protein